MLDPNAEAAAAAAQATTTGTTVTETGKKKASKTVLIYNDNEVSPVSQKIKTFI